MATFSFWKSLSEKSKGNWPAIYKQLTGKDWNPLTEDGQPIQVEPKLESLEEIDQLMKKPGRGAWHE